jgi:hypothetical protein
MEPLLYASLIFFAVSGAVYFTLKATGEKGESGVLDTAPVPTEWKLFDRGESREMTLTGDAPSRLVKKLWKGVRQLLDRMRRVRVSEETETLFFVLQFLMYMESGMTILAALQKTQETMESVGYRLAEELRMINFKLRAGATFGDAIEEISNGELKEFFLVISQSQQVGVPISDALKTAIVEFDETRVAKAEARASRVSVFLAVPIVFGFLPAIFILILMPALHGLFGAFK